MIIMSLSEFNEPAELYSGKTYRSGRSSGLKYRRFESLAEAVKFAVEQIPGQLNFATIDAGGTSYRAAEIRSLYGSDEFPLPRS
jgi:hypothetical protein